MPYISSEQLNAIVRRIQHLEEWKTETEKSLDFLKRVTIEGKGRITLSGAHLTVNANIDTKSIENFIN